MYLSILLPVLFMACHLGRPPQSSLPHQLETNVWAVQPGVEALIKKEVLQSMASMGAHRDETVELNVLSVTEQPQLYFPEKGTLWLVRIEMRVSSQKLPEPLSIIGQAHYTFEGPVQFSMSRQSAYAQAALQISEQLTRSLGYSDPVNAMPSR